MIAVDVRDRVGIVLLTSLDLGKLLCHLRLFVSDSINPFLRLTFNQAKPQLQRMAFAVVSLELSAT